MKRIYLVLAIAASLVLSVGCTTKGYVRNQTTPLIDKTNNLDDLTAKNTNSIRDVDQRAQSGIRDVQSRADQVNQKALAAGQSADQAQQMANKASAGVVSLGNTVANLDNFKPVKDAAVHFAFDKDNLNAEAKQELDQLIAEMPNVKHYIITVEGGADAVGSSTYNYELSERRANSVIQYLASNGNVPAHKIFLIGLGKDKPVADNKTREGRAQNRRVDVHLMTNIVEDSGPATTATRIPSNPPR